MNIVRKVILWIIVIACCLLLLVIVAVPPIALNALFNKKVIYDRIYTASEFGLPDPDTLTLQTWDDLKINVLELRPDTCKAVIICLSGIEKPSVTAFYGHARLFLPKGYATLLVDVRGHGESDGNRICAGYHEMRDVKAVTDYIRQQPAYQNLPVVAMGLSLGGGIAINSMAENPDIDILVTLSAFSSLEDVVADLLTYYGMPSFIGTCMKPSTWLSASIMYGVNPFTLSPKSRIKKLNGRPALLMHTRQDSNVPFKSFERLTQAAIDSVETYVLDIDEHFITPDFFMPEKDEAYTHTLMSFLEQATKQMAR